jgi:cytochrome c2
MKPQEPIPHNYSMAKLNLIFALSSLFLLAFTGLMVMYDYVRGWKWFQLEFNRMQQERIEQDLATVGDAKQKAELAQLDASTRQREVELAGHRDQYRRAQDENDRWEGRHYAADEDYRFAKASLDAKRYEAEMATLQKRSDAGRQQQDYAVMTRHVNELQLTLQDVTRSRDAAKAQVDSWLARIKEVEDKKKKLTERTDLLNKQLAAVKTDTNFFLLNAPMLDFISPTFRIDQIVLPDLFVDVNYMHVPRVDRCQTCHRAIDRQGFESKKEAARLVTELQAKLDTFEIPVEKAGDTKDRIEALKKIADAPYDTPNPFRTHPKLDTFVGSASPHPLLEYGCTACHRGQDRATEFGRAGHTPMSGKQEHRWAEGSILPGPWDYKHRHWGFQENEFNETPMYPRQYYESGCLKCHSGQVSVDKGDRITHATQVVELYGCYACHKISNWRFTDLRKPGPDLTGIAEKTTPAWAARWIAEPHDFRSTTRMPSFFYQRNMIGPAVGASERSANIARQNVEIQAIVSYLFARSTHRVWTAPGGGDAAHGKQIVESVGCMGCHIAQETVKDSTSGAMRVARRDDFPLERNYGFNLVGVGTKTNPAWIYNWVKNPRNYYPDAPMPSLRLTDQEASDVTAYLVLLRKPQFMDKPLLPVDPGALHELAKSYMVNTLTDVDADSKLRSMSRGEQLVYLGQRSIEKYGCYSCHNIKGFEGLKPIGTELTIEGSKALHLFDFGFIHDYIHESGKSEHVLHNVPSWVYNKVRSPRVYDDGRTKSYNDKLKMPNFHLSEGEATELTTVVLALTKDLVAPQKIAAQDSRSRLMEEGRKRVSQHNCRACHVVDGYGRAIASTIADTAFLPPDLSPEGSRVQSPWLFQFLKDPTVMKIRPWLSVRMPTFHFTDEETNTLVTYFSAKGNVPQFDTTRNVSSDPRNVEVGRAVFTMLRCAQCHKTVPQGTAVAATTPAAAPTDTASLAPNLNLARVRLRHAWISDWIRRPNEFIPGTRMPTNFPRDAATGGFQSPLALAIDTPPFAVQKASLVKYFKSEEELRRTMGDAVSLTEYLRDYIWSLGPSEMRAASPAGEEGLTPVPQQVAPLAIPPLKSSRNRTGSPEAGGR